MPMNSKTPYEIRLELLKEAREILQARAKDHTMMPSQQQIIDVAEELNRFVSKKPNQR
jgi:hypothetical protein